MSNTATAELEQATVEADEEGESIFLSKCVNQKLFVRQPYRYVENGLPIYHAGESITFVNGQFRTSDPRLKSFIRNHRLFGTAITELLEGDLVPSAVPATQHRMMRGAATTKPAQRAPQERGSSGESTSNPSIDYSALIREALAANPDAKVAIPCGFGDCDYIALGEDEPSAKRALNGHRTVRGHHPADK